MLLSRGKTKSDLYTCMHGKGTHPGARHVRSRVRRFGSSRNKFIVFLSMFGFQELSSFAIGWAQEYAQGWIRIDSLLHHGIRNRKGRTVGGVRFELIAELQEGRSPAWTCCRFLVSINTERITAYCGSKSTGNLELKFAELR